MIVTEINDKPPEYSQNGHVLRLIDDGHDQDIDATVDVSDVQAVAAAANGRILGARAGGNVFLVFRYQSMACGDGDLASNETCDDGNLIDGDGCDHNCQPTGCGNGVVTAGEICGDGNTADGDCCSSTCIPMSCPFCETCDPGTFTCVVGPSPYCRAVPPGGLAQVAIHAKAACSRF
jgi:cysteine-rich repeat protein